MVYKRIGNKYIIRLDEGEEIIERIRQLCKTSGIRPATISGIGAATRATIGIYELSKKQYSRKDLTGDHEITNITGNITTFNGEVYLHFHANFSDREQRTWGGHLNEAYVGGTCELIIDIIDCDLDRVFDERVGLNIIKL